MAYGNGESGTPPLMGGSGTLSVGGVRQPTATFTKTKTINYGTSDQIYAVTDTVAADAPSGAMPKSVNIQNSGPVPLIALIGYETWTNETSGAGATRYLHIMLEPGRSFSPPIRALISTEAASTQFDGTVEENTAPSSVNSGLLWKDSTANLAAHVRPAATDPITITLESNQTNLFRVNDLIQIGRGTSQTDLTEATYYREILRVQSITDTEDMVCERALYGTDAGDYDSTNWSAGHAIGQPVYLPFFNAYHDTDKYSVAQTDSQGRFKCMNFFGFGRAASGVQGIVPGSIAFKFYDSGYQELGMSGITSSTNSGLAASTIYGFDITVDGSGLLDANTMRFTTDNSNVNFGGTNGVLSKIQAVLDQQYYTTGSAIFEEKVTVGIVGGDIRFTSGQKLSTSAILLATGSVGMDTATTPFGVGRFPAIGNIDDPVAARLPDDVSYDPITYTTSQSNVFCYDNGLGVLTGMGCSGSVNYETGAITLSQAPPNAEFVFSVAYNSAFSGRLDDGTAGRINSLKEVLINSPSQKKAGKVQLTVI